MYCRAVLAWLKVAVLSCMMLTVECGGKSITTVEGLADPKTGELDPLETVSLADIEQFYLPGLDLGAHNRATANLTDNGRDFYRRAERILDGIRQWAQSRR